MQGRLSAVDVGILAAYAAILVAMGWYYRRKCRTSEQFMVAGHGIPAWAAGLAVMSAYTSSISYIATPAQAYDTNWHPIIFSLCIIPVAWIACRYAVGYYRRTQIISVYSFLEQRLGTWGRVYAALSFLLYMIGRVAVILYLVGLLLSTFIASDGGGHRTLIILIVAIGTVTIIYTLLGGMEAVIWTDVMQSAVMIGGIIFCAAVLTRDTITGNEPLMARAVADHKFSLGSLRPSLADRTVWVMLIFGVTENLRNLLADQNFVQKYCSVPTEAKARRSVWIAMGIYIPLTAIFLYIGTALYAFYAPGGRGLPDTVTKADQVFPYFIATQLPVGLRGLVVAAIIAAAMSTVDSALNCSATVYLLDFHKRFIRPGLDDRRSLRLLRIATVITGIIGTAAAMLMIWARGALDVWWQISGIFGGGILGLFLLSLMKIRLSLRQGLVAIAAAVATIAWATFLRPEFVEAHFPPSMYWVACRLDKVIIGATGTAALLIAGIALHVRNLKRKT